MTDPAGRCRECGRLAVRPGADVVCDDCLAELERTLAGLDSQDGPKVREPNGEDMSLRRLLGAEETDE